MARAITTVLMLLGAALLAVWLWREPEGDPALPSGDEPAAALPDPARTVASAPPPPALAVGSLRVQLEVARRAVLRAAPATRIEVVHHGQGIAAPDVEIVAGDATAGIGSLLARVRLGGNEFHRRVAVRSDGTRAVELGFDRPLRGRVVDAAATPIADVTVWFGGAASQVATTDADGRFEAMVPAGAGVPVVVSAAMQAWQCRFVDVHADHGATCDFVLAPAVPLLVQLTGPANAMRGAHLRVVPDGSDTGLALWPQWAQGLLCEFAVDADGRVVVDGLPGSGDIAIEVSGPAMVGTRARTSLRRTAATAVSIAIAAVPAEVTGVVADEHGRPAPFAEVRCAPRGAHLWPDGGVLMAPVDRVLAGTVGGRTDAEGRFALVLPDDGELSIAVRDRRGSVETTMSPPFAAPLHLLLPAEIAPFAALRVPAPLPGRPWTLIVDGAVVAEVEADGAAVTSMLPCVADVTAVIVDSGNESVVRRARDLLLVGEVELPQQLLRD